MRLRDQRGQSGAEYAGVLLVIAAVMGVLFAGGLGSKVASSVERSVCRILDLGTCATPAARTPDAPACINASTTRRMDVRVNANVRWVKLEKQLGLEHRVVQLPDGRFQGSIRIEDGSGVAPGLKSKLPVDLQATIKNGGTITFAGQTRAEVEATMRSLATAAARTATWLATRGVPGCIPCLDRRMPDYYADVRLPAVESVGATRGTEYKVRLGTDTVGRGRPQGKPSAEPDTGPAASADAQVTVRDQAGVTRTLTGPNAGQTVVNYENEAGFTGNAAFGPLVKAAFGVETKQRLRSAVTFDADGNPTKLSITMVAQGAFSAGAASKLKDQKTFRSVTEALKLGQKSGATGGGGYELTTEIDLTNPQLRRAVVEMLSGVDPETGERVDPAEAAAEVGRAIAASNKLGLREFKTAKTSSSRGVDVGVGGAEVSTEESGEITTGYWLRDPETGRWTRYDRCPGSTGGTILSEPPN